MLRGMPCTHQFYYYFLVTGKLVVSYRISEWTNKVLVHRCYITAIKRVFQHLKGFQQFSVWALSLSVCFKLLACVHHTSHKSEHYLRSCPLPDDIPILAPVNPPPPLKKQRASLFSLTIVFWASFWQTIADASTPHSNVCFLDCSSPAKAQNAVTFVLIAIQKNWQIPTCLHSYSSVCCSQIYIAHISLKLSPLWMIPRAGL
jgi:hypothetical protein